MADMVNTPMLPRTANGSAWAPLHEPLFRSLWVAAVISYTGTWMQNVGSGWLMTQLTMSPFMVGLVQGGTQALSRSLFASLIPRDKSGEFFGFFGVAEKFAGIFGPAIFFVINWLSGSSRGAIVSIIAFFVVGGLLLTQVDVAEGQRLARAEEAEAFADKI